MKSGKLISAIASLVALAIPVSLAAQEHHSKHHQYNLIDIGTLGGPNFFFNFSGYPNRLLGRDGTVTGGVDTSVVDPLCFNNPDCFVEHAFKWQEGELSDLDALPGGSGNNDSQAFWRNDRGQTVGVSTNGTVDPLLNYPFYRAVLWSDQGKIKDLGTLGGQYGVSQAINSRGQVVGVAANAIPDPYNLFDYVVFGISGGTQSRAFLWDKETGMQDLGTLGTGNNAFAEYVNERGQIAGFSYTNTTPNPVPTFDCGNGHVVPTMDPFFWENGTMTDLGTFGGNCGVVRGLNNRGQVTGYSFLSGDILYHPFRWDRKGGLKDLGLLGGVYGATYGINDAGDAVGWADLAGDVIFHAVIWPNGTTTPTDLGVTAGFATSVAAAINSKGQIIGCLTSDPSGNCFPYNSDSFLWENGDMVDVNTLVPSHPGILLSGSEGYINDQGEILLLGLLDNGDVHAFLLTPCDDNHRDGGGCKDHAEGVTATAQSSSALVTQNPTTMTEGSPSPSERMGALHGRFGFRSPHGVPQRGTTSEARAAQLSSRNSSNGEANYITDEVDTFFKPPRLGNCMLTSGRLNGTCVAAEAEHFCARHYQPQQCPRGRKPKREGFIYCPPGMKVDQLRVCRPW
jgi:probable HAF family extracellular repeat protein